MAALWMHWPFRSTCMRIARLGPSQSYRVACSHPFLCCSASLLRYARPMFKPARALPLLPSILWVAVTRHCVSLGEAVRQEVCRCTWPSALRAPTSRTFAWGHSQSVTAASCVARRSNAAFWLSFHAQRGRHSASGRRLSPRLQGLKGR